MTILLERMIETTTTTPIKTAIIEDQDDIREGLASLISFTNGLNAIWKAINQWKKLSKNPRCS